MQRRNLVSIFFYISDLFTLTIIVSLRLSSRGAVSIYEPNFTTPCHVIYTSKAMLNAKCHVKSVINNCITALLYIFEKREF